MTTTFSCRVQYLDDTDPFQSTSNYPEPPRPPCYVFLTDVQLENQITGLKRFLDAPHKIEDCALQLYWNNGTQSDFGIYLDLDSTLDEQADELEGFLENKKNAIVLRTQLSIRVHACTERLLNSSGRDLRKALFALRQIFQDDKDLVHAFVTNEGLDCLIKVGSSGDQNQQNYILKALGQVMLYVDGMNGVMSHIQTVQWLYTLLQSKSHLVVKTAFKLLLLFVEYAESNTMLVMEAITTVDSEKGTKPWSHIMALLSDTSEEDVEVLVYAMTLVNKMLNAIADQDVFYDATDAMEEQGMEKIIEHFTSRPGLDDDLLEQFRIYDAVLSHEDGEGDSEFFSRMASIRKTSRIRSTELRRSKRRSESNSGILGSARSLSSLTHLPLEEDESDRVIFGSDYVSNSSSPRDSVFYPFDQDSSVSKTEADLIECKNSSESVTTKANLNRRLRRNRQRSLIYEQSFIGKSVSMTNLTNDRQSPPIVPVVTATNGDDYAANHEQLRSEGRNGHWTESSCPLGGKSESIFSSSGQQKYRFGSPDSRDDLAVAPAVRTYEGDELRGLYHQSTDSLTAETEHHDKSTESSSFAEPPENDDSGNFSNHLENSAVNRHFGFDKLVQERKISESVAVEGATAHFPSSFSALCSSSDGYSVMEYDSSNGFDKNSNFSISRDALLDGPEIKFVPNHVNSEVVDRKIVNPSPSAQLEYYLKFRSAEDGKDVPLNSFRGESNQLLSDDIDQSSLADHLTAQIVGGLANLKPWCASTSAPAFSKQQDVLLDEKRADTNWEKIKQSAKNRPLKIRDLDFTSLTESDDVNYLGSQGPTGRLHQSSGSARLPPPPIQFSPPPPPPPPPMSSPSVVGIPTPPPPPPPVSVSFRPSSFAGSCDASKKSKKTMKLHWREAKAEFFTPSGRTSETIWTKLAREVGHVDLNTNHLEHLFELKSQDAKGKDSMSQKQEVGKKEITILDPKRSNAINICRTSLPGSMNAIKTAIITMDGAILSRESIEKLLTTMMPTDEEKAKILEAQSSNSGDVPLGTAEQFLLAMGSIPELYSRLKLWLFRLDFESVEREISEPLSDLMKGIEELRRNVTFGFILATLLSIGNFLNGSEANGFTIEYLSRVPEVKDTVHKHTLLHHLVCHVLDKFPDGTDLYSEVGAVSRCAKVDWDELSDKLRNLEFDCKASWTHLTAIAKHELPSTLKNKLTEFLLECSTRIVQLQTIHARVMNRFVKFLLYLGYSPESVKDYKVHLFCKIISEFALEYRTTREKVILLREKKANQRERKKTRGKMILDSMNTTNGLGSKAKARPATVIEEGSDLNKILQNGTTLFKSRKRASRGTNAKSTSAIKKYSTPDDCDPPEDDLLESVLRTATSTEQRPYERRQRTRITDRKSIRRTLKNGLTAEEASAVAQKDPKKP